MATASFVGSNGLNSTCSDQCSGHDVAPHAASGGASNDGPGETAAIHTYGEAGELRLEQLGLRAHHVVRTALFCNQAYFQRFRRRRPQKKCHLRPQPGPGVAGSGRGCRQRTRQPTGVCGRAALRAAPPRCRAACGGFRSAPTSRCAAWAREEAKRALQLRRVGGRLAAAVFVGFLGRRRREDGRAFVHCRL